MRVNGRGPDLAKQSKSSTPKRVDKQRHLETIDRRGRGEERREEGKKREHSPYGVCVGAGKMRILHSKGKDGRGEGGVAPAVSINRASDACATNNQISTEKGRGTKGRADGGKVMQYI